MPINERGYFQPLNLPPLDKCWPELAECVEEYAKHIASLRAAEHRLTALEAEQARAEQADNAAYAKALRDGKPDPGNKHVEKLVADRKQTRRTVEALKEVLVEVENEIADVFDATSGDQLEAVEEQIAVALDEYDDAIAEVENRRAAVVSAAAMKNFLNSFSEDPEGKGYRPNHWPLYKLDARTGGTISDLGLITDALRFDREVIEHPEEVRRLYTRIPGPLASRGVAEYTREVGGEGVVEVQMA